VQSWIQNQSTVFEETHEKEPGQSTEPQFWVQIPLGQEVVASSKQYPDSQSPSAEHGSPRAAKLTWHDEVSKVQDGVHAREPPPKKPSVSQSASA